MPGKKCLPAHDCLHKLSSISYVRLKKLCHSNISQVPWCLHAALASQENPVREQIAASNMQMWPKAVKLRQLCSKQLKDGAWLVGATANLATFGSDNMHD
jgi:hypothetical protein